MKTLQIKIIIIFFAVVFPVFAFSQTENKYHHSTEKDTTKTVELEETEIVAYQKGTYKSHITPLSTEVITGAGLQKLACCNLSESFENSASVTVGFTDAVSGAKQVQLLGLSSVYSQMMAENIPTMRGLAQTFGWSYVPSQWLQSIQISKGASSVVNGYESLSGQINLEMHKPPTAQPLFINFYGDLEGRYEANVTAAHRFNDKWSAGLLAHVSAQTMEIDRNGDSFLDAPTSRLVNLYNRWTYDGANGECIQTGIKFLDETRRGGQVRVRFIAPQQGYSSDFQNRNFTVENKTGFPLGKNRESSVGIISNFTHYEQTAAVGMKTFDGAQNSWYENLIFTSFLGEKEQHKITAGASFLYDNIETSFLDSLIFNQTPKTALNRTEFVSGAFAEYTLSLNHKFVLILGARGDYNSYYRQFLFSPRANVKYDFSENMIFRASAGRGFRSANVISENIGLFASSRRFNVSSINTLGIEEGWNYGANLSFVIPVWKNKDLNLSLDYFHTRFTNQVVVDFERNRNEVFFYSLQGKSFANVWQVDLSLNAFKGFDMYAAFRYNNTQISYSENGGNFLREKPFTLRYRGILNLSYATRLKKWVFDFTAQLNGKSRIPSLDGYAGQDNESPVFPMFFAQITKNSKRFDVYLGVENLTDYRQKNPIIDATEPFGQNFDSSRIWGPLMGRKFYIGTRIRIGEIK